MPNATCSVDECDRRAVARGWCNKHWSRWKRHGDPTKTLRRPPGPCLIDGCDEEGNEGRGWCTKHYRRYYRRGDPLATSRIVGDDEARFWSYVNTEGPIPDSRPDLGACHVWTGNLSPDGYATLQMNGNPAYMARWIYERERGEIPEGHEPDHLCRVRHCVNPDHLEAVTHRENVLRGESFAAVNARKTHCPQGHEYTPENTRRQRKGGRLCRTCQRRYDSLRR